MTCAAEAFLPVGVDERITAGAGLQSALRRRPPRHAVRIGLTGIMVERPGSGYVADNSMADGKRME
ncbi:MAG: hypothetical protein JST22_05225 [Bacteroidetes bacterium]|nr:hypothetical protein [Bacteroidota bacterium]